MASDGPSWERAVGLARGLEEEENNALVNPTVVDASGCISMAKTLATSRCGFTKTKLVVDLAIDVALGHFT